MAHRKNIIIPICFCKCGWRHNLKLATSTAVCYQSFWHAEIMMNEQQLVYDTRHVSSLFVNVPDRSLMVWVQRKCLTSHENTKGREHAACPANWRTVPNLQFFHELFSNCEGVVMSQVETESFVVSLCAVNCLVSKLQRSVRLYDFGVAQLA